MERLEYAERLQGALAAITAAVVGVIANLALWFALHVLFRTVPPGGLPMLASLDWRAGGIAVLAALMLFRWRRGIIETLALCALAGLALSAVHGA
jgi:chromate transporter